VVDQRYGVAASPVAISHGAPVPRGGGAYKLGNPYRIGGHWYVPRHEPNYDRSGIASWYGPGFHGRRTANGEVFNALALTAAHPTLPLPSLVEVTNLATGQSALVRVNDRGPYAHDHIIDLSRRVAEVIGFARQGTARVRVRYVGPAPLDGSDHAERAYLARRGQSVALR
jgi:rare lipoprotein A